METELLYSVAPLALIAEGAVIGSGTDVSGAYLVFDRTPAYPQGGGQPGDKGYILLGDDRYLFTNVRRADGEIRHYLPGDIPAFKPGQQMEIAVDGQFRSNNSVLHTAGHLIACLAHCLYPQLMPVKGYHFPEGSYVEFESPKLLSQVEIEEFLKAAIKMDLHSDKRISVQDAVPLDMLKSPFIPKNLPDDRSLRLVAIEGFPPMPCGGTHVEYLTEIPAISIRKSKWSKNVLRVSYSCF